MNVHMLPYAAVMPVGRSEQCAHVHRHETWRLHAWQGTQPLTKHMLPDGVRAPWRSRCCSPSPHLPGPMCLPKGRVHELGRGKRHFNNTTCISSANVFAQNNTVFASEAARAAVVVSLSAPTEAHSAVAAPPSVSTAAHSAGKTSPAAVPAVPSAMAMRGMILGIEGPGILHGALFSRL